MLAGCATFQSHPHQMHHKVPPSAQPASPSTCAAYHLLQQQHVIDERSTHDQILPPDEDTSFQFGQGRTDNQLGEDFLLTSVPRRSGSHDELAKLVTPFLKELSYGSSQTNRMMDRHVSSIDVVQCKHLDMPVMGEPPEHLSTEGDIAELACRQTGIVSVDAGSNQDVPARKISEKQWAGAERDAVIKAGLAEEKSPVPLAPNNAEEAPIPENDEVPTCGDIHDDYTGVWRYNEPPDFQVAHASSISPAQVARHHRANSLGLEGTTTASASWGSCSPPSVAMSTGSVSQAPSASSSLNMLSPPGAQPPDFARITRSPVRLQTLPLTASELRYQGVFDTAQLPKAVSFSELMGVGIDLSSDLAQQRSLQVVVKVEKDERQTHEAAGLELVNLLVACVEAISAGSLTLINHLLARLGRLASPSGSAMHRLATYFTEGLACRVSRVWPHIYQPLQLPTTQPVEEGAGANSWQLLNYATPLVKFSHFTANEMILQAFEGEERVHVIDLDIKQGLQWPALFHCLAKRRGGPPQLVRVTGIGESKEEVQDAGDRLAEFAHEMDLKLEFHGVVDKLEDLRLWMLHVKAEPCREAVAVNCILQLHRALHDESGTAARNLLSLIQSTRPKVVALVEQEAECHDQPSLEARFSNALRYFAVLFDALDASLPAYSPARSQVEAHFAAHIRNIVACDGSERTERYQSLRRWHRLLTPAGFRSIPLSPRTPHQAHILLRMFSTQSRYSLLPHAPTNHLTLAYLKQPIFTASAWAPAAGSISTFRLPKRRDFME